MLRSTTTRRTTFISCKNTRRAHTLPKRVSASKHSVSTRNSASASKPPPPPASKPSKRSPVMD